MGSVASVQIAAARAEVVRASGLAFVAAPALVLSGAEQRDMGIVR